jgi:uncharacterized protein
MPDINTAATTAPFHAGEVAMQLRAGVRERLAAIGPQLIRSAMPEQHRLFFPLLPFIVLGATDPTGQPWATALAAAPGFVSAPDAGRLHIGALPAADDPVHGALRVGHDLGLLGIELSTRRRNRANGVIVTWDGAGFTVQLEQSFGNCPKYIQRRALRWTDPAPPGPVQRGDRLTAEAAALVRQADTFFIASHAGQAGGTDVSHRGGRAGFVRVGDGGRTLSWPDFSGNNYFNTLGNLAVDPRAGLLFIDFDNGDLLHLAGEVETVWDGAELQAFAGAQRLQRMRLHSVLHRRAAWPLRGRLLEPSPALDGTGVWA